MQSSASVNLIKSRVNSFDEILKWALTVGRLLVIITEIVAFSTFIYRFSLDRTLIDLHSKIRQEQAIVGSLKDRESLYRSLQERISVASTVSTSGSRNIKILNDIVDLTPSDITFTSFSIDNNEVAIDSNVSSISSLSSFIKSLRGYSEISSVGVDSITNQSSTNSIDVVVTAKLKEEKTQ